MNNAKRQIYFYIVTVHRHVFDNYYKQEHKITDDDKQHILFYNTLCKRYPEFRWELRNEFDALKKKKLKFELSDDEKSLLKLLRTYNVERYFPNYD